MWAELPPSLVSGRCHVGAQLGVLAFEVGARRSACGARATPERVDGVLEVVRRNGRYRLWCRLPKPCGDRSGEPAFESGRRVRGDADCLDCGIEALMEGGELLEVGPVAGVVRA